jgi:DNA-binding response OmpR family regulator
MPQRGGEYPYPLRERVGRKGAGGAAWTAEIILCTGQSGLINRAKAMEMGIYDYLEKPVTNYTLMVAMWKALVKNQQRLDGIPIGLQHLVTNYHSGKQTPSFAIPVKAGIR